MCTQMPVRPYLPPVEVQLLKLTWIRDLAVRRYSTTRGT